MKTGCDQSVWFDIPGATEYLKVSKSTLYECMKDGRLAYYYIEGTRQRRLKREDLEKLMKLGAPDEIREEEA